MKNLAPLLILTSLLGEMLSSPVQANNEVPIYYQRVCREGKCRHVPIGTSYYISPEYYDYDPSYINVPGSWVEAITGVF